MEAESRVGSIFAGRFRIDTVIGSGGLGVVYLAHHEALQRSFALRLLARPLAREATGRFRRAARAVSRVVDPHVALLFDFGHTEERLPFLVTEHVLGATLAELIAHGAPLPPRGVLELLAQIADGLGATHRSGVAHGELRPGAILIDRRQGQDEAKLIDVGLAALVAAVSSAPPRELAVDVRADLRSWAALARALCGGDPPPALRLLAQRCEADRPPSATTVAAEVRALLASLAEETRAVGLARPPVARAAVDRSEAEDSWREIVTAVDRQGEPMDETQRRRALLDLAYAVRDRGLGSASISDQIARLVMAEDRLEEIDLAIAALQREQAELERSNHVREAKLSRLLGQLEHEKAAILSTAEDNPAPAILPGQLEHEKAAILSTTEDAPAPAILPGQLEHEKAAILSTTEDDPARTGLPGQQRVTYEDVWSLVDRLGSTAVEVNQLLQRIARQLRARQHELRERLAQHQQALVTLHLGAEQLRTRLVEQLRQVRHEGRDGDPEIEELFRTVGI